jgi:Ca2+-binding EF-hand superfamily protein
MNRWMKQMAWSILGLAAWTESTQAQNAPLTPLEGRVVRRLLRTGDLPGPIDSLQDLKDTGKLCFKLADQNNDGLISQKEALDSANLLVGGFFFRADANGDGTVSKEEARQARDSFLKQRPLLSLVLERAIPKARDAAAAANALSANPIKMVGLLLDANNDRQLQATEVRKAVQTAVQGFYETADTNRDGQLSPSELNAAMAGMARSIVQSAVQAADADHNGSLSQAEYDKAIQAPADMLFHVLDANGDGQLSPEEAQEARRMLWRQVKMLGMPDSPR